MWSYKKIGLSHEMGLIDTAPLCILLSIYFQRKQIECNSYHSDMTLTGMKKMGRYGGIFLIICFQFLSY